MIGLISNCTYKCDNCGHVRPFRRPREDESAVSRPVRWEYKAELIRVSTVNPLERALNCWGRDGWELVQLDALPVHAPIGDVSFYNAYFKRPLPS